MATIKLLGKLGEKFGKEYRLFVATPAEAIRALCVQLPGFKDFLINASDDGIYWRVATTTPEGITEEELHYPIGSEIMTIAPQMGGEGGFGRVLLGVALVGAAFLAPGGILGISQASMYLIGGSLILGGITQMLTPKAKTPKDSQKSDSFMFDRAAEVGRQGTPVPVLYGRRICSDFVVVSSGLRVDEIPV